MREEKKTNLLVPIDQMTQIQIDLQKESEIYKLLIKTNHGEFIFESFLDIKLDIFRIEILNH